MTPTSLAKKTLLLTGATGYLGSNILSQIMHLGVYHVIILKRSFSNTFRINDHLPNVTVYNIDEVDVSRVFEDNHIDIILHCATDYGRKNVSPMQVIEANLILPTRLLEYGSKHNVSCFINTDTILDKRINHYSRSKKHFLDWLHSYEDKLACINVELGHFYGPGDDKTKFVSSMTDLLLRNVPTIELTPGEQIRNFVYIEDIVDVFMRVLSYSEGVTNGFHNFQVCSDEHISIKEAVILLKKITGNISTELIFGALPYRDNEVMKFSADPSKVQSLGWKPKLPFQEGVRKMIEQERMLLKTI